MKPGTRSRSLRLLLLLAIVGCTEKEVPPAARADTLVVEDFARSRGEMVEEQLRSRGITNEPVLAAMGRVPRHELVPVELRSRAYADHPLPIGHDQTISQPYIVAFMSQALQPEPGDTVLEIGTGSGYQAAVLGELVKAVYTIEIVEPLGRRAQADLARLNYTNVFTRVGDGYLGWPENAPFDSIIVTCSPDHIPQPLIDQLKDGGRMIIPVGDNWRGQDLVLLEKMGTSVVKQAVLPVRFVPMTGRAQR